MYENNTVGNASDTSDTSMSHSGGSEKKRCGGVKGNFPLDVDIPLCSAAICGLIFPTQGLSGQRRRLRAFHVMSWAAFFFFFLSSKNPLLLPRSHPIHPPTPHFTHHFAISHSSYLILLPRASLFFFSLFFPSLPASLQPSPHLSRRLPPCMLHYLQCGNA